MTATMISRGKVVGALLLLGLLALLAVANVRETRAQGLPPAPVLYSGAVTVAGAPAPEGPDDHGPHRRVRVGPRDDDRRR